jgi:hypothetical protein
MSDQSWRKRFAIQRTSDKAARHAEAMLDMLIAIASDTERPDHMRVAAAAAVLHSAFALPFAEHKLVNQSCVWG